MWNNFFRNINAAAQQWFESLYFEPVAKPVKVRINQSAAPVQTRTRQRRMFHSNDRY